MKILKLSAVLTVIALLLFAGCSGSPQVSTTDQLDREIRTASTFLNARIPAGSMIVILEIESDSTVLSDYIVDDLIGHISNDGFHTVIDRQRIDAIRSEQGFQWSGEVGDDYALLVGKFLAAQTIVTGTITQVGNQFRLSIKALNVQTAAVQGQYNSSIFSSPIANTLMASRSPIATSRMPSATAAANQTPAATAPAETAPAATAPTTTAPATTAPTTTAPATTAPTTTAPAVTAPAALRPGTYTFFPRPRASQGGVDRNAYIERIVVRGEFLTIYITDRPLGTGSYPEGAWSYNSTVILQDIDRPARVTNVSNAGWEGNHYFITFSNVTATRFRLMDTYSNPNYIFDEIILGDPD